MALESDVGIRQHGVAAAADAPGRARLGLGEHRRDPAACRLVETAGRKPRARQSLVDALGVDRVLQDGVPDAELARRARRVAEEQDLAFRQLAAGRGRRDPREQVEAPADGGVRELPLRDLAERQGHPERGRPAGVRLGTVGVAGHERRPTPVRLRDRARREQRALHLHVMDVGRILDTRLGEGGAHRARDLAHLDHRPDLFGEDVARHRDAEREALLPGRSGRAALAREDRGVRREHAFRAAGPHEGDPPADLVGRDAEHGREQKLVRQRRVASREVVRAAVALRLADQGDDRGRIDRAFRDQGSELGHVVRSRHGDPVNANLHPVIPAETPRRSPPASGRHVRCRQARPTPAHTASSAPRRRRPEVPSPEPGWPRPR